MSLPHQKAARPILHDLVDDDGGGDRASITEVDGTIAKFEMAYSPGTTERFAFGPPLWTKIPGYLFLAFAIVIVAMVLLARYGSNNSSLYIWVVEGDRNRVFGSAPLAFVIFFAALGNVVKTMLRGVIVTAAGIEARIVKPGGFPSVKRWTWMQIDRVIIDGNEVMLELWNGTYERLPKVHEGDKLASLLARIATSRGRGVTRLG